MRCLLARASNDPMKPIDLIRQENYLTLRGSPFSGSRYCHHSLLVPESAAQ